MDTRRILFVLNKRAGHALKFEIELVENLQLTERGKIKSIIKDF